MAARRSFLPSLKSKFLQEERFQLKLDSTLRLRVHLGGVPRPFANLKTAFDNYTRLARSLLGISSLWVGKDHLVYVRGSGFVQSFKEEYLRYRFRDIQAFTITETSRIGMGLFYLFGAALFMAIIALNLGGMNEGVGRQALIAFLIMNAVPALIFLLLLFRHLILGPTCQCVIRTSLKEDRIRPLNRLHAATQCLEQVSGALNLAQEDLVQSSTGSSGTGIFSEEVAMNSGLRISFPVAPSFGLLSLFSLCVIGTLHLGSTIIASISMVLASICFAGLVASLLSSIRFPTPGSVRNLLWASLGMMILFLGAGVVYYTYVAVVDPAFTLEISGPMEAFAGAGSVGGFGFYLCFLLLSIGGLCVSIIGFLTTLKWRARIENMRAGNSGNQQSEAP